jgi:hypothetical protein
VTKAPDSRGSPCISAPTSMPDLCRSRHFWYRFGPPAPLRAEGAVMRDEHPVQRLPALCSADSGAYVQHRCPRPRKALQSARRRTSNVRRTSSECAFSRNQPSLPPLLLLPPLGAADYTGGVTPCRGVKSPRVSRDRPRRGRAPNRRGQAAPRSRAGSDRPAALYRAAVAPRAPASAKARISILRIVAPVRSATRPAPSPATSRRSPRIAGPIRYAGLQPRQNAAQRPCGQPHSEPSRLRRQALRRHGRLFQGTAPVPC